MQKLLHKLRQTANIGKKPQNKDTIPMSHSTFLISCFISNFSFCKCMMLKSHKVVKTIIHSFERRLCDAYAY